MYLKIFFGIILLSIIGLGSIMYLIKQQYPNLPLQTTLQYYFESFSHPHKKLSQEVIGFFPYWQKDQMQNIQLENLTELNFFSLTVASDGHLAKVIDDQTDPGWLAWNTDTMKHFFAKARIFHTKTGVTISALTNESIEQLLSSKQAQTNLITDIVDLINTSKIERITLDFEYIGEPDPGYNVAFTQFSRELHQTIKKNNPNVALSLSLMPLSARQKSIFEFRKLQPYYDHFILMTYEFYSAGSDIAGPTAPMSGFKEKEYFFDVQTTFDDYKKVLPKEKLIEGVPYYGREWAVKDGKTKKSETLAQSDPNSYAAVISYARAKENNDLKKNQCTWDKLAQETWCWFTDDESKIDHQLWIADDKSIQVRFDFAKKQHIAGVALWTLGFDKSYQDLWLKIGNTFGN